jgi:Na+/H+ antiporter NhaA
MSNVEHSRVEKQREKVSGAPSASERPKNARFGVVVRSLQAFVRLGASSSILLLLSTVVALIHRSRHGQAARNLIGKQLGIFGTALAVRLGLALMPGNTSHRKLYGVSVVARIGLTVTLFIAALAFSDASEYLDEANSAFFSAHCTRAAVDSCFSGFPTSTRQHEEDII